MKVIFLGTGPSRSIPIPAHRDLSCLDAKKQNSKSKRTRSSLFLNYHNLNLLIDISPDFLEQVKKNKIKRIDAALITHAHFDAYGGLKDLNEWQKSPLPIFCRKQTWQVITRRFNALKNLKFKEINPAKKFKINNLEILALQVYHSIINEKKFPTLAYKINDLIYCSDIKKIPAKSLMSFKNIKTLILDGTMFFNKQIFSHLNTADAILLAQKLKVKNLYLTQVGHSYPPYKIAQSEINNFVKKNKITTKVFLAFDGLKIKL